MNKLRGVDPNKLIKSARRFANKHSAEILTGLGIAGMITTTVLAVKATPKALKAIEEKKIEVYDELDPLDVPAQGVPEDVKLKPVEIVKVTWKYYFPAAVTCAASAACILGAHKVTARRYTALMTAYDLSQTALNEYKEKVIETIGEKKEQKVVEAITQDKVDRNPPSKTEVIVTGKGNQLFFDELGGRYFEHDAESIKRVENILNKKMIDEMYVSLNEMYYELGLSGTKLGNDLGWNLDDGLIELDIRSAKVAEDGRSCIVLDYNIAPRYNYSRLM